jgi:hypothetical protein
LQEGRTNGWRTRIIKSGEQAAQGSREAAAKEEAKNESKMGHDLANSAVASKNDPKASMQKAQKKNKKGDLRMVSR